MHGAGKVDAWQLDEIWPSLAHAGATPSDKRDRESMRYLMAGVLDGMYEGRPELGNRPMLGLVYVAHPSAFAKLATSGTRALLASMNHATIRVVGEQYPAFRGDARRAARTSLDGQRTLARSGNPNARAIAHKYVAGMTPGAIASPVLGGARAGTSAGRWQRQYIAAHRGQVAGFGMFNWTGANATPPSRAA